MRTLLLIPGQLHQTSSLACGFRASALHDFHVHTKRQAASCTPSSQRQFLSVGSCQTTRSCATSEWFPEEGKRSKERGMVRGPQLRGLKRDVLHLYRQIAREATTKNAEERNTVMTYARGEFERYHDVDPKNYQLIEHLVRKGHKQLKLISSSDISGIHMTRPQ